MSIYSSEISEGKEKSVPIKNPGLKAWIVSFINVSTANRWVVRLNAWACCCGSLSFWLQLS